MEPGETDRSRPFTFLLGFILVLILLNIFLPSSEAKSILFDGLILAVLIAGARAVSRKRSYFVALSTLTILVLLLTVAKHVSPGPLVLGVRAVCLAFLLFYVAAHVFKRVLMDRKVTTDTIMGAICAYLLTGMCWSFFYGVAAVVQLGSFSVSEPLTAQGLTSIQEQASILLYFSFVTLTTLGFGDITPLTSAARSLCWLEAVVGQMFIAILVARLVGLHILSASMDRDG